MNNFLTDLAKAHQKHEGYYPGSISFRQNNPGNLRGRDGVFLTFKTYAAGLEALKGDLRVKITNKSAAMNNYYKKKKITYEKATFLDYVSVYAPSADRNNPMAYCLALCDDLKKYKVSPATPLSELARLVEGEINYIGERKWYAPIIPKEERIKGLERRIATSKDPETIARAERLIERLKRRK